MLFSGASLEEFSIRICIFLERATLWKLSRMEQYIAKAARRFQKMILLKK